MNRALYTGDCLEIIQDYIEDNSVDLIYLDPPFNSNSYYNLPFTRHDKNVSPVRAFHDTWTWDEKDDLLLSQLEASPNTRTLANIVLLARDIENTYAGRTEAQSSLAAYVLNMAIRIFYMRGVLKDTGSIYIHCDPTASHYLKLVMDVVFGRRFFRNEIVWSYRTGGNSRKWFGRKHDNLLFYSKTDKHFFDLPKEKSYVRTLPEPHTNSGKRLGVLRDHKCDLCEVGSPGQKYRMADMRDVWSDIKSLFRNDRERLGYPTQKPLKLLDRVVRSSSKKGDLVLDPFCGCGTTLHAAELLERRWIGIDISAFSSGLVRERMLHNFIGLASHDIYSWGIPTTILEARELAKRDKFEFEKWVCGAIGANGLYKDLGARGADGGVDGVMIIDVIRNQKVSEEYAIIQVKGGNVTPDSVKALSETVRRKKAVAGILVCFQDQMRTVENQRSRDVWSDDYETYPFIQGYSIEDLLRGKPLKLPSRYGRRRGAKIMSDLI